MNTITLTKEIKKLFPANNLKDNYLKISKETAGAAFSKETTNAASKFSKTEDFSIILDKIFLEMKKNKIKKHYEPFYEKFKNFIIKHIKFEISLFTNIIDQIIFILCFILFLILIMLYGLIKYLYIFLLNIKLYLKKKINRILLSIFNSLLFNKFFIFKLDNETGLVEYTSQCEPFNSGNPNCINLDDLDRKYFETLKKTLEKHYEHIVATRRRWGKYRLRGYRKKLWSIFRKMLDKRTSEFNRINVFSPNSLEKTNYDAFFQMVRRFYFIDAWHSPYNPLVEFFSPSEFIFWLLNNKDKAIFHLISFMIIIFKNKKFIKENFKKLYNHFIDLLNEITEYEDKDYKTQIKNAFVIIKNIFKTMLGFIPLILLSYVLGHLIEPFRVFFMANDNPTLCNSKYLIFKFQYYLKVIRINLFYELIEEYFVDLGFFTRSSNYGTGPIKSDVFFGFFAALVSPWNLKQLRELTSFYNQQDAYEALRNLEVVKYNVIFHEKIKNKFKHLFTEQFYTYYDSLRVHLLNSDIDTVIRTGLALFGANPNSKFNKMTQKIPYKKK